MLGEIAAESRSHREIYLYPQSAANSVGRIVLAPVPLQRD